MNDRKYYRYEDFLIAVCESVQVRRPLYMNEKMLNTTISILDGFGYATLELAGKMLPKYGIFKWYNLPRTLAAAGIAIPAVTLLISGGFLTKKGIKAASILSKISNNYKENFRNLIGNEKKIDELIKNASNDFIDDLDHYSLNVHNLLND